MKLTKNKLTTIVGALLFTLTLTGCGSDDNEMTGDTSTDDIESSEEMIEINEGEIVEISESTDGVQEFTFDESDVGAGGVEISIDEDGNQTIEQ